MCEPGSGKGTGPGGCQLASNIPTSGSTSSRQPRLGSGYRRPEFDAYGADFDRRYAETDARVRAVRELWGGGRLLPPPIQNPVPIWLGYNGPQGARRAGLLGEGLLTISPDLHAPYRQGLIDGGHDPALARMAGVVNAFVTDDPERDWPTVAKHHVYQWNSYRRHMTEGTGSPTPRPIDPERSRAAGLTGGLGSLLYGTADQVAAAITRFTADVPVQTVFLWASLGGMDELTTMRHVQTICNDLAPLLA